MALRKPRDTVIPRYCAHCRQRLRFIAYAPPRAHHATRTSNCYVCLTCDGPAKP